MSTQEEACHLSRLKNLSRRCGPPQFSSCGRQGEPQAPAGHVSFVISRLLLRSNFHSSFFPKIKLIPRSIKWGAWVYVSAGATLTGFHRRGSLETNLPSHRSEDEGVTACGVFSRCAGVALLLGVLAEGERGERSHKGHRDPRLGPHPYNLS